MCLQRKSPAVMGGPRPRSHSERAGLPSSMRISAHLFAGQSGGVLSVPGCREPLAQRTKNGSQGAPAQDRAAAMFGPGSVYREGGRYCFEASQRAVITPTPFRPSLPLGGSLLTIRIAVQVIQELLGHTPLLISDRSISMGDSWYRSDASSKRSSSGPLFWTNSFSDSIGQRSSVAKAL